MPTSQTSPALDLRDRLAKGELRASEVAAAFLARIGQREPEIGAWAFLDRELVMAQAEAADRQRGTGRAGRARCTAFRSA